MSIIQVSCWKRHFFTFGFSWVISWIISIGLIDIAIVFVVLLGIGRIDLAIMIYKYSTSVSTNGGWNKPFLPMQYATQSNVIHLILHLPNLAMGFFIMICKPMLVIQNHKGVRQYTVVIAIMLYLFFVCNGTNITQMGTRQIWGIW